VEIIDDTCGRLVEPDSPAQLAAALQRLIRDASHRKGLGAGGPARARSISGPGGSLARLALMLGKVSTQPGAAALEPQP
jgi:hypothetical protein